jgi:predicted transcriptional regulator
MEQCYLFVVSDDILPVLHPKSGKYSRDATCMKNRRSKLEIYLDVLQVIKEGTTKPTRIMYGSNLSWNLLQSVLSSMADQDLITMIDESDSRDKRTNVVYMITHKGDSVLKYYHHAKGLIDVDVEGFNPLHITRAQ